MGSYWYDGLTAFGALLMCWLPKQHLIQEATQACMYLNLREDTSWLNKWMNAGMNGWLRDWTNEQTNKRTDGKWMYDWVTDWQNERMSKYWLPSIWCSFDRWIQHCRLMAISVLDAWCAAQCKVLLPYEQALPHAWKTVCSWQDQDVQRRAWLICRVAGGCLSSSCTDPPWYSMPPLTQYANFYTIALSTLHWMHSDTCPQAASMCLVTIPVSVRRISVECLRVQWQGHIPCTQ